MANFGGVDDTHESYGKVAVHRVSGRRKLFAVGYPQDHYLTLRISRAKVERMDTHDFVFAKEEVIEVALSEVQWARLVCSPNTEGVECTLSRIEGRRIADPPQEREAHEGARNGISERAKKAASALDEAEALLTQLRKGGSVKKADLAALSDKFDTAKREFTQNLPYLVKVAEEAIQTSAEKGKAEVEAYQRHAMHQLAERALGAHIAGSGQHLAGPDDYIDGNLLEGPRDP